MFATALLTSMILSAPAKAFTSSVHLELFMGFSLGEGRTSGHEEITRQALNKTKELLKANRSSVDLARAGAKLLHDLDFSKRGVIGALAKNPIIKGVYCSDFPLDTNCVFSLKDLWFGKEEVDWHNGDQTQSLHFLRNYDEKKGLVSAYQACYDARVKIERASITAALEWKKGNVDNALFLLGHAAHIIQDSFSHAHTKRQSAAGQFQIQDVCYYGVEKRNELLVYNKENMACFHPTIETNSIEEAVLGDSIWIRSQAQLRNTKLNYRDEEAEICSMTTHQYIFSEDLKTKCLNLEARLGREATVKYLYLMAQDFFEHRLKEYDAKERQNLALKLQQNLFDGSQKIPGIADRFPSGIAKCGHLSR